VEPSQAITFPPEAKLLAPPVKVAIAGDTGLDVTPSEADNDPRPAFVVDEELVALVTASLTGRTSKSEVADEVVVVAESTQAVVVVEILVVLLDDSETDRVHETVQGQSTMVSVVASVAMYVFPFWLKVVAPGQYVVKAVTTVVVHMFES